jgi:hypothetical protein
MWRDRHYGHLTRFWTVMPKHSKCRRCSVFGVRLEDLPAECSRESCVLVCMQARMAWIGLQQGECFPHRAKPLRGTPIFGQIHQRRLCFVR